MQTGIIDRARTAAARQAWPEVYELLMNADRDGKLDPGALPLLGDAAWLTAHPAIAVQAWQRSYTAHLASGDRQAAAVAAARVSFLMLDALMMAPFRGWIRRAERLTEDDPGSAVGGFLGAMKAMGSLVTGDPDRALTEAREAIDLARRPGDPAGEALARSVEGRALVALGDIPAGLALMDESAVAAMSGELDALSTAALYCTSICAFQSVGEYERAEEWTHAMEAFCANNAVGSYNGRCRVHRAEIKRVRGRWREAEQEALGAADELAAYGALWRGWALSELGQIRSRLGDLKGASAAFEESDELGWDPQPGLALLLLGRGETEAAAASIRDALDDQAQPPAYERPPNTDLRRAPMLDAAVEIDIAAGDLDAARMASAELNDIALRQGTTTLRAVAAGAAAAVALADGDLETAAEAYRDSAAKWQAIGAPFEAARARVGLGHALQASGKEARAIAEFRAARTTFDRLGATVHARAATIAAGGTMNEAPEGSRHTMRTFMFTDIVRSTDLVQAMGDDAWHDLLHWHDTTLSTLIGAHHGAIVKHVGDGIFAAFQTPRAGIECGVAIQRALAEHRRTNGFAPRVRIGLHAADVIEDGDDFSGRGVNVAARIGALAEGGEIIASRETSEVAGHPYAIASRRTVTLKGITEAVDLVGVDWK
ncbi:MAG: adenylate/guanylate cyclase domain-containing protein [Chloroflexota bacterium]|nr:adenylate/guanylate cyclase domain-containing protein [Chloroflexota bacterium]